MKQHDAPLYFCFQIDASKHKNRKMFPVCVRYFNVEYSAVNCIIDFFENADESADGIFRSSMFPKLLSVDIVKTFTNFAAQQPRESIYNFILIANSITGDSEKGNDLILKTATFSGNLTRDRPLLHGSIYSIPAENFGKHWF